MGDERGAWAWVWAWVCPPELVEGVRLFNTGEYFECHEVLEGLWRREPHSSPLRALYHGLIQAAVAFYHAERGNFVGAVRVLERALPRLRPYVGRYRRLQLEAFVPELERWLERFREMRDAPAPTPCASLDPSQFPKLRLEERQR